MTHPRARVTKVLKQPAEYAEAAEQYVSELLPEPDRSTYLGRLLSQVPRFGSSRAQVYATLAVASAIQNLTDEHKKTRRGWP